MEVEALLTSPFAVKGEAEGEESGGNDESEDDPLDTRCSASSWLLRGKNALSWWMQWCFGTRTTN